MTPQQRLLARHALGLPNRSRRSYRNRYLVPAGHPAHAEWSQMVDAGDAEVLPPKLGSRSSNDCFVLTRLGAEEALDRGETLDAEDFA